MLCRYLHETNNVADKMIDPTPLEPYNPPVEDTAEDTTKDRSSDEASS